MNPQCLMCDAMIPDGYLCSHCIRKLQLTREERLRGHRVCICGLVGGFHDRACPQYSESEQVALRAAAKMRNDPVNPAHYQGDYVMRIIEDFKLGFALGNVVKYLLRAQNKNGIEDCKKALWYLQRYIDNPTVHGGK